MKEYLLRLAKKHGVTVTLPVIRPGQLGAQPVTFSSNSGEVACIALIPANATPEDELLIIAREVAYVIARDERRRGGGEKTTPLDDEAEEVVGRILAEVGKIADKRLPRG